MDSIGGKVVCSLKSAAKGIMLCLILCAASAAWADFIVANPVTSATQNYTWKYVGSKNAQWDQNNSWQNDLIGNPSNSKIPGVSTYEPFYFDDAGNVSEQKTDGNCVNGWNLRMGLFNGTTNTISKLGKLQGGQSMWISVDATSQLIISAWGAGNVDNASNSGNAQMTFNVASADGIKFNCNFEKSGARVDFHYYFTGAGSVDYKKVNIGNHYIKRADVALSHPAAKALLYKKLISFSNGSGTFNSASDTVVYVDGVPNNFSAGALPTSVAITTSDKVGTCQLVQTEVVSENGVYLYYVDGPVEDL